MIFTKLSKQQKFKKFVLEKSDWHKHFVWWPRIIYNDECERIVWLTSIYRRALFQSYGGSWVGLDFVRWEYCVDDFELLQYDNTKLSPTYKNAQDVISEMKKTEQQKKKAT